MILRKLKKYDQSLIYLKKWLKTSWFIRNPFEEISAYD